MQDPKNYAKKHLDRLREFLIRSVGLAVLEFPEKLNPKSGISPRSGPTTLGKPQTEGLG